MMFNLSFIWYNLGTPISALVKGNVTVQTDPFPFAIFVNNRLTLFWAKQFLPLHVYSQAVWFPDI